MSLPVLEFVVVLAAVWMIYSRGVAVQALPCPDALDIEPCICTNNSVNMDMDCSDVLDEFQLEGVFAAYFPATTFSDFTIEDNMYLTTLPDYVFGDVTFTKISIHRGVLEMVEEFALTNTAPVLEWLQLYRNNISDFPFHTLPSFTSLELLDLSDNSLEELPELSSPSLERFYVNKNPISYVSGTTFSNVTSLTTVYLQETNLTEIFPGTFSGLPNIEFVYLYRNKLTEVQRSTVEFSVKEGSVFLSLNNISSVAVDAFPGMLGGMVEVQHNVLTELLEEVWRPLLEEGVNIKPYGNPLTCGCDIAWLLNTSFIGQIEPMFTTCANGELLALLDPEDYAGC